MLVDGATTEVAPAVAGATVAGELVAEQTRGAKVISFQEAPAARIRAASAATARDLTVIKITDILTGGAKPALAKRAAEPKVTEPKVAEPASAVAYDHAAIAAGAKAAMEAAKAKGIDTDKFQHLDQPIGQADDRPGS